MIWYRFFIENKNAIKLEFFPGRCHSRVFIKAFMVSPVGVETHKRLQNQAQVQFISIIPDKLTKFDQIYRTVSMSIVAILVWAPAARVTD